MVDAAALQEVNDLYWGSELSVNQIADKLDLSKGRLYQMISPKPTGRSCPSCGTEADYPNRTAKEKGVVLCSACGFEGTVADLVDPATEYERFGDQLAAATDTIRVPSKRIFWGAVLLGAAVGIVLARRRS